MGALESPLSSSPALGGDGSAQGGYSIGDGGGSVAWKMRSIRSAVSSFSRSLSSTPPGRRRATAQTVITLRQTRPRLLETSQSRGRQTLDCDEPVLRGIRCSERPSTLGSVSDEGQPIWRAPAG